MILQKEIADISFQKGLLKSIIDKDWAIGHFIDAIYSVSELRETLIFKGGTCLKKCYFPSYRFSEDLDFTSSDLKFKLSHTHLNEITSLLYTRTGMQTHVVSLKELVFNNERTGYESIISFWGSDHPKNQNPPLPDRWHTRIKIEVILYETILFPEVNKSVFHEYSDSLTENANNIPCYSIEEIVSEKMRSMVQRSYSAPRDFYDLWYLSTHFSDIDYSKVKNGFFQKMTFKGYSYSGIEQLINPGNDKKLNAAWKNSLAYQIIGYLPDYELVKSELTTLFNRIL